MLTSLYTLIFPVPNYAILAVKIAAFRFNSLKNKDSRPSTICNLSGLKKHTFYTKPQFHCYSLKSLQSKVHNPNYPIITAHGQ